MPIDPFAGSSSHGSLPGVCPPRSKRGWYAGGGGGAESGSTVGSPTEPTCLAYQAHWRSQSAPIPIATVSQTLFVNQATVAAKLAATSR